MITAWSLQFDTISSNSDSIRSTIPVPIATIAIDSCCDIIHFYYDETDFSNKSPLRGNGTPPPQIFLIFF